MRTRPAVSRRTVDSRLASHSGFYRNHSRFCHGLSIAIVWNRTMKGRCTLAAATAIGLLIATGPTGASEKLTLRVTPNVSSAPSTVIVRAYVTPNAGNSTLLVEAD